MLCKREKWFEGKRSSPYGIFKSAEMDMALIISAAVVLFFVYQYNSQLWVKFLKVYDLLHDRHQLKIIISSFGPYSPLVYILIQILQVVVAPIPGGAIEFLGGYLFGVEAGFIYSMIVPFYSALGLPSAWGDFLRSGPLKNLSRQGR